MNTMVKILNKCKTFTYCRHVHMLKGERVLLATSASGKGIRPHNLTNCYLFGSMNALVSNRFGIVNARYKSTRKRSKKIVSDSESESDSDDEEEEDGEDIDDEVLEEILDGSADYRVIKVHTQRALNVLAKGLGISNNAMQKLFYQSKVLLEGKVLLKKARQVHVGCVLDLITEDSQKCRMVKRVEVVKISDQLTRSGKPILHIRVWRKPLEVEGT